MSSLIRYESPALSLSDLFDGMFDESIFARSGRELTGTTWPRVDIVESENDFKLHADLPGLAKEDIKIQVEDGVLTVSGEKKVEKREEKNGRYRHLERSYGAFARSFSLPDNIDTSSVDAHYKDGVLELTLKKTEVAKPKAIEVKVN